MAENFKGIIIAVNTFDVKDIDSEIEELKSLGATSGIDIIGSHIQNRNSKDPKSYVGMGFLETVAAGYDEDIDYCIINDEITASQNRKIESVLDTKVIDRTQVILDIFSLRALSKAGQLQVELAQLEYLVPRLKGQGINLSRLGAGIGTRGPGETKLETDRRHINTRIKEIKNQLKTIINHRERYREQRRKNQVVKVALIGYTNAGKSTLFNIMADSDTLEQDKLFATLDPKTRKLELPSGFNCVLTDTVGFIQNLPTTLVESFKSTLEEASDSDFIIHVIDNSADNITAHYDTVKGLMQELDMTEIPQIVFFNKTDKNNDMNLIPAEHSVYVAKNTPPEEINKHLEDFMKKEFEDYKVELPAEHMHLYYSLKGATIIESSEMDEETGTFKVEGHSPEGGWIERIVGSDDISGTKSD
ncbi:GTPase HflX [Lacicoccus qingdaonensis]|uniref:GTPase HflX n=1 Tax=Lacicoccus qingdaonensis TaxID=576118 RepID=A0A1G9AFJ9_9BACL|nr:GTPase HflX [Salinicoccus qingdaonensis]SDK25300.1 GTP-binding protein HflX [Salinicoccus qingdaonensis]